MDTSSGATELQQPSTLPDALARMLEAEETLRALGSGEVDAFVVSDRSSGRQVFTLSTADRPYRMFVENMRDGAATISETGLILFANGRLIDLLARTRGQVVGAKLSEFVVGDPPELKHISNLEGFTATIEFELLNGHGRRVPVLVGISPLEVDGGQMSCLTFTDLSAQKEQEQEIERLRQVQVERLTELQDAQAALTHQATHDPLTGLPNRALLMDRIAQALSQAERSKCCTAVFFLDLDGFKHVNDTHGHAEGDEVLRRVGEELQSVLRGSDTVARIGGDEFVVLARDVVDELHAVDIGARLIAGIRSEPHLVYGGGRVTASIGIAVSAVGRGDAETLLNEADIAMYQAKSNGGNRVEVFDVAVGRLATQRTASRRMLQAALDDHRMVAFYQPIMDIGSDLLTGFEALARVRDIEGRVIPPSEFIAVAEESGLITRLGADILGLACAEATGWGPSRPGGQPLTVAVNLSARQFEGNNLTATVQAHLGRTGLAPNRLHLELTETATIDLRPDVLKQLGQLRGLGVEIGLDDFGTGYGSLTHLRRLPLTFVKIDRSFVDGLGTVSEDERIVSAVINLAANLGLRSIAEGVETADQLRRLRELGCDQAQGHFIARPKPAEDLAASLLITRV